jgi:hypothetical protein
MKKEEKVIKGTVKWYKTVSEETKISTGKFNLKDNLASVIPFDTKVDLYAEYDPVKRELRIREL